jgi:hypothetical protein
MVDVMKANGIILFYAILIMVTSFVGYKWKGNKGFNWGMVIGLVLSIFLWMKYGRKMARV